LITSVRPKQGHSENVRLRTPTALRCGVMNVPADSSVGCHGQYRRLSNNINTDPTKDRNTPINAETAGVTPAFEYSSPSWHFELFQPWMSKSEQAKSKEKIISQNAIAVRDSGRYFTFVLSIFANNTSSVLTLAPWPPPNSYISMVLAPPWARTSGM